MCFSKSSSASTTSSRSTTSDERIGADAGAVAFRATNADVTVSSDKVALASIAGIKDGSRETLKLGTDFITKAFTEVLNQSDKRSAAAEANAVATRKFARSVVEDSASFSRDVIKENAAFSRDVFKGSTDFSRGIVGGSADFSREVIRNKTASSDDKIIKLTKAGIAAAVFVLFVQSGAIKQIKGLIK